MSEFRFIFLLLIFCVHTASATQWGDWTSGDLHRKDRLVLEDYSVEAMYFSNENSSIPMVLLNLSKSGHLLKEQPLSKGEYFSFNDSTTADFENVMVEVENISIGDYFNEQYRGPSAKIKLKLAAAPDLVLHIVSDKELYDPGEEIGIRLDIENDGLTGCEDIRVEVSADPALEEWKDGEWRAWSGFIYNISELGAGKTLVLWDSKDGRRPKKAKLRAPCPPALSTYKVNVSAQFLDTEGKVHHSIGGCFFDISGQMQLHKNANELMEQGKNYPVVLSLRNFGNTLLTANLSDRITDEFSVSCNKCSNSIGLNLSWGGIKIPPGDTSLISYGIKPKIAGADQGSLILPPAIAEYTIGGKTYEMRSETVSINVINSAGMVSQSGTNKSVQTENNLSQNEVAYKGASLSRPTQNSSMAGIQSHENDSLGIQSYENGSLGMPAINVPSSPNVGLEIWALSIIVLIYWLLGKTV